MGAGVKQSVINGWIYRRLQRVKRDLEKANVPVHYTRYQLCHGNADGLSQGFNINYRTLRASNGECAALPHITVIFNGNTEKYDHLQFKQGVLRIEQLFGKEGSNGNQQG